MAKKQRDAKHRKKYRLPVWIRSQEFRLLNDSEKSFLGYLYSFGPDTCWQWNCRLAKKFHVTKRTIRRRLRKLKDLGFVWIKNPYGNQRLIHVRLVPTPQHWVNLIGKLALSSGLPKHRRRRQRTRGFPPPVHNGDSEAFIEQTRHAITCELVHRGSSFESAAKVADIVIAKSRKKHVTMGGQKCPPRTDYGRKTLPYR